MTSKLDRDVKQIAIDDLTYVIEAIHRADDGEDVNILDLVLYLNGLELALSELEDGE